MGNIRPLDAALSTRVNGGNLVSGVNQIRGLSGGAAGHGMEGVMMKLGALIPEMVTFSLFTTPPAPPKGFVDATAPYPWPVGIIEYGAGNALMRVEFDLPRFSLSADAKTMIPGAVVVTIPGSQFTVKMRDDSNVVPPGCVAAIVNHRPLGMGEKTGFSGQVFAAYGARGASQRLTLTKVLNTDAGKAAGNADVLIPAFAKAARVVCSPSVALTVTFNNVIGLGNGPLDGPYVIPAGTIPPELSIPGQCDQMNVAWGGVVNWVQITFYLDL